MQKEFTKADLKDGMVVEQKDNDMYLVIGKKAVGKTGCNLISGYTDDLCWEGYEGGSIIRIYKIIPDRICSIDDVLHKDNLELIWERTETKHMTAEENFEKEFDFALDDKGL